MSTVHRQETSQFAQNRCEFDLRSTRDGEHCRNSSVRLRFMLPSEILYSQESIRCRFADGNTLEDTFRRLLNNELSEDDIELVEAVKDDSGRWWAVNGHRRLFLYKILERFNVIDAIPVKVLDIDDAATRDLFDKRKTTRTNGKLIRVRDCTQLERKLMKLAQESVGKRRRELTVNHTVSAVRCSFKCKHCR
jgi:hypothetical protein